MSEAPVRVTVLMSAYNSSGMLSEAIDSILAQSLRDFRLVVYDDASTDNSVEVLRGYDDPRLDIRLLTENRGLTRNLVEGIEQADTPYIARMDADDIALPERLAEQVAYLEENPEIDVLGTNVVFFNDAGQESLGCQPADHDEIALTLFFNFTMMHPTVMLRRSALVNGGFNYDPHFRYSQDFDLWSRMIPRHRFANLQKPLLRLREHSQKVSRAKRTEQQELTNEIRARQIKRILPDVTFREIEVFAGAARGDLPETRDELDRLEAILQRLIDANHVRGIYPPSGFEAAAAGMFRSTCRAILHRSNVNGARYLFSPLRFSARAEPPRARLSFLVLCALAAIGIGSKG